ncbi:MAG: VIT1/CCC1 transporter family protein [Chlamydiae bacterium]|nr:VIT1/CCC1 transporter family protein [Chlamydiota bacterium]
MTEMYRAKGFTGKLLEDVIDVLMSDDNRLLQIMLEEELGLTLEIHEHPLKQAVGAAVGVILASTLLIVSFWLSPTYALPVVAALLLFFAATVSAKLEKNKKTSGLVWQLAVAGSVAGASYIISKLFI